MRMQLIVLILLSLIFSAANSQTDSVTLFECLKAAHEHAAIQPQLKTYAEIYEKQIDNITATNFPALSAFGKAWYQSDAISMNIPVGPNTMSMEVDRFQYNFGLEANQKIYDGSMSRRNKEVERATYESEKQRIEKDLYSVNDEVSRLFFTVRLNYETRKVLQMKKENLQKKKEEIGSGVRNGVIKRNELDKIEAELLVTEQQILEIESKSLQAMNSLSVITGIAMKEDALLYLPDTLANIPSSTRPELSYFDAEINRTNELAQLKSGKYYPKLFAYGQLGYSYPGLNFFENESDYFYILGAKLSWTIFDWNQVSREKQVIKLQQSIVDTRRNDFERNRNIMIENEQLEQEKLASLIEIDKKIIEQRTAITKGSATALENGMITAAGYLDELNAEIRARTDMETHKIQYQSSIVKQYLLKGIDVKSF